LLLPNEEGDGYEYLNAIVALRGPIVDGTLSPADLFGFWLPLYQLFCGALSALFGDPLLSGKLVSALCGAGVCLLVFALSFRLTAHLQISLAAFALVALNPTHILYSSFSMTDVPNAFLILSGLYFALGGRWALAAGFLGLACLTRIDSWVLLPLIPAAELLSRRRVSVTTILITLLAPAIWFYISWSATGNPLEYFSYRAAYIENVIATAGSVPYFSLSRVAVNLRYLTSTIGPAVLLGTGMAVWLVARRPAREQRRESLGSSFEIVLMIAGFGCSLAFLLLAYLTKSQPDIWPRYGLLLFAMGAPILAWATTSIGGREPGWARMFRPVVATLCAVQLLWGLVGAQRFITRASEKREVAAYLRERFLADPELKAFCDDRTVRVLSSIPEDRFIGSAGCPAESATFLHCLNQRGVQYIVYDERDQSTAARVFREIGEDRIKSSLDLVRCPVSVARSSDLRLYARSASGPER
jgi:hypothetical protein